MKRKKSPKHRARVGTLDCVICGDNTSTEVAHISFNDPRIRKRAKGFGSKVDDIWTIPLCSKHHREQHAMNEEDFWEWHGIDPHFYAMAIRLELWP